MFDKMGYKYNVQSLENVYRFSSRGMQMVRRKTYFYLIVSIRKLLSQMLKYKIG